MSGDKESPFGRLPPEMVVEIMNFLKPSEKKNLREVCRRFRWLLDYPTLGLVHFQAHIWNDTELRCLLQSKLKLDSVEIRNLKNTIPNMTSSRNKFPLIQGLVIERNNSEQNVILILKYGCVNVSYLKICEQSLAEVDLLTLSRSIRDIKFNHLSHLELAAKTTIQRFIPRFTNHMIGLQGVLKFLTSPSLNTLTLGLTNIFYTHEFDGLITQLFDEFHGFIGRHAKTLKTLDLRVILRQDIGLEFRSNVPTQSQELLTKNFKLEKLIVRISHFGTMSRMIPSYLWETNGLRTISWSQYIWPSVWNILAQDFQDMRNGLETLIRLNEKTLENLSVSRYTRNADIFQINWLQNCSSLKKLHLRYFDEFWQTEVKLPSLTHLELRPRIFLPRNLDEWIIRNFKNIEKISVLSGALLLLVPDVNFDLDFWRMNVPLLQNFFTLPNLKEIRYSSVRIESQVYDNQICVYCENTPGFSYSAENELGMAINSASEKVVKRNIRELIN